MLESEGNLAGGLGAAALAQFSAPICDSVTRACRGPRQASQVIYEWIALFSNEMVNKFTLLNSERGAVYSNGFRVCMSAMAASIPGGFPTHTHTHTIHAVLSNLQIYVHVAG